MHRSKSIRKFLIYIAFLPCSLIFTVHSFPPLQSEHQIAVECCYNFRSRLVSLVRDPFVQIKLDLRFRCCSHRVFLFFFGDRKNMSKETQKGSQNSLLTAAQRVHVHMYSEYIYGLNVALYASAAVRLNLLWVLLVSHLGIWAHIRVPHDKSVYIYVLFAGLLFPYSY